MGISKTLCLETVLACSETCASALLASFTPGLAGGFQKQPKAPVTITVARLCVTELRLFYCRTCASGIIRVTSCCDLQTPSQQSNDPYSPVVSEVQPSHLLILYIESHAQRW